MLKRSLLPLFGAAAFGACASDPAKPPPPPAVASVTVTPDSANVVLNRTLYLLAVVRDSQGDTLTDRAVTWSSSDAATVYVQPVVGRVQAIRRGRVTITATVEGKTGHATIVTVAPITFIQLMPNAAHVSVGDTARLHATLYSSDGFPPTDSALTWTSSDTTRAVVNASGVVTGRAPGTLVVSAAGGTAIGTTNVIVNAHVASVTISPADTSVYNYDLVSLVTIARDAGGDTLTQWRDFCPAPGCHIAYPVTLQSLDTTIATFVSCCTLQARSAGIDTIVATADGVSARMTLHVTPLGFTAVGVGGDRACGLNADSAMYCWASAHPQQAAVGQRFVDVAVGSAPCGLTLAGVPLCYGDVSLTSQGAPPSVRLDVGLGFVCGLTAGNAAWCSGAGGSGQLGSGTDTTFSSSAQTVTGGHSFASVSTGGHHACALTTGGAAYCWGSNAGGALGNGDTSVTHSAVPLAVTGGLTFVAISAGSQHSCGIVGAGDAYCWGSNGTGQLGTADTIPRSSPTLVAGGLQFVAISAGSAHTCGLVSGGAAYCWGATATLGNGSDPSTTPVAVSGGLTFLTIKAGLGTYSVSEATCGRTNDGVYCWGFGITGVDGNTLSLTPVKVQGQQ